MRSKIISFIIFVTPALCQYAVNTDLQPDVSFGENNDRFDITNLVQEQRQLEEYLAKHRRHRYKKDKADAEKVSESSEESRRSFRYPGKLFGRRWDGGFAYHDDMRSDIGGTVDEYEKGLDKFRKNDARRTLDVLRLMREPPSYSHRRNDDDEAIFRYEIN